MTAGPEGLARDRVGSAMPNLVIRLPAPRGEKRSNGQLRNDLWNLIPETRYCPLSIRALADERLRTANRDPPS